MTATREDKPGFVGMATVGRAKQALEEYGMSDPNTITIPADLGGGWTPQNLREIAKAIGTGNYDENLSLGASSMLCRLADEIERQAPRPEGWYSVKDYGGERVLWWNGTGWSYYADGSDRTKADGGSTITPVTIGDPS